MPQRVVDRLEPVEIDISDEHVASRRIAQCRFQLGAQPLHVIDAIGQAGHCIVHGVVLRLGLACHQFAGRVAHASHHCDSAHQHSQNAYHVSGQQRSGAACDGWARQIGSPVQPAERCAIGADQGDRIAARSIRPGAFETQIAQQQVLRHVADDPTVNEADGHDRVWRFLQKIELLVRHNRGHRHERRLALVFHDRTGPPRHRVPREIDRPNRIVQPAQRRHFAKDIAIACRAGQQSLGVPADGAIARLG